MRRISFITALIFITSFGYSQSSDIYQRLAQNNPSEGTIELIQAPGVADMVKQHIEQNSKSPGIDGYRIQLYSGSGPTARKEAESIKGQMMSAFPDQKVYLTYNAPFWRVRAGSYRNRSETTHMYNQLKALFPSSYPIRDNTIRYSDL